MSTPETITHQDKLLNIDTNVSKFIEGLLHPNIKAHPLFLDPYNGVWVFRVKFGPGVTLPMHFHTGTVHLYTMSGCWYYSEYPDQKQTAGCYLFEPGGSVHQFNTPADNTEDTDTFMVVTGANVNFGPDGGYMGIMDAGWLKAVADQAIKAQGLNKMSYISGSIPTYTK